MLSFDLHTATRPPLPLLPARRALTPPRLHHPPTGTELVPTNCPHCYRCPHRLSGDIPWITVREIPVPHPQKRRPKLLFPVPLRLPARTPKLVRNTRRLKHCPLPEPLLLSPPLCTQYLHETILSSPPRRWDVTATVLDRNAIREPVLSLAVMGLVETR